MTTTASGVLLWCRATLLSAVTLLAGIVAHVSAHGLMPGPVALAALLLIGTTLTAPLLRTQASTTRIVVLLVAGQTVVHAVLTALAGHRDEPIQGGLAPIGPLQLPHWVEHLTSDLTGAHLAMAIAHAAASAAVGVWLTVGERALWSLLRSAAHSLNRWARDAGPPVVVRPMRVVPGDPTALPPTGRVVSMDLRRRGPPRSRAA